MPAAPRLEIRLANPADADEMVEFQRVYEEAERAEFADADVFTWRTPSPS